MICAFLLLSHFAIKKLIIEHCTKIIDGKKSISYKSDDENECQTSKLRIDSITSLTMFMNSEISNNDMLKLRFKNCEKCRYYFTIHQIINVIVTHLIFMAIVKFTVSNYNFKFN
jgi:hypothetical protein